MRQNLDAFVSSQPRFYVVDASAPLITGLPEECVLRVIGPVGNAEYLDRLKKLAARKKVESLHELTDPEIADHFRRAAVLVYPTPTELAGDERAKELLGLAVLEAMTSNCHVIVTAAALLPELVENEVSGLVVPPNGAGAIQRENQSVIGGLDLWSRLADSGTVRIARDFVWSKAIDRCIAAYGITECPA